MHPRAAINSANAAKQANGFWTPDRVERLRVAAGLGFCAKECARRVGDNCTPAAAALKAYRLKIPLDGSRLRRIQAIRAKIAKLEAELREIEQAPDFRVSHETSEARA